MIVRRRPWRNWQGKRNGCAALVRFVTSTFLGLTSVSRMQSHGGKEYWLRPYHLPMWNVSQSIKVLVVVWVLLITHFTRHFCYRCGHDITKTARHTCSR